ATDVKDMRRVIPDRRRGNRGSIAEIDLNTRDPRVQRRASAGPSPDDRTYRRTAREQRLHEVGSDEAGRSSDHREHSPNLASRGTSPNPASGGPDARATCGGGCRPTSVSLVQRLFRSPLLFAVLLLTGAAIALLVADGINNPPSRDDLGFVRVDTTSRSHVLIL